VAAKKPGAIAFYFGIGVLGIALVSSIVFNVFVGGPLIVGALVLIMRGLSASGRKAVGQPCAGCERTVVIEHHAEFCERCDLPMHAACAGSHVATAHKIEGSHPFR
jgi:hypothetical protein